MFDDDYGLVRAELWTARLTMMKDEWVYLRYYDQWHQMLQRWQEDNNFRDHMGYSVDEKIIMVLEQSFD